MKSIARYLLLASLTLTLYSCSDDDDKNEPDPVESLDMGICDSGIGITEPNALKVAAVLDICRVSTAPNEWGLVDAKHIRASGGQIAVNSQFGIMSNFGNSNTARKGNNMLVLSTGRARTPSQANSCGSTACSGTGNGVGSAGIPAAVPGCSVSSNIKDDVGIELTLRVPESATGFAIDHQFFTFDYPELVCSSFNDQFLIMVNPPPAGSIAGNCAFDASNKPIGVNCSFIPAATSGLLTGTGFDIWGDAATTGWLRTTVPVTGGTTITIRLLIFDVGDDASDSSVLIDNFRWIQNLPVAMKTEKI